MLKKVKYVIPSILINKKCQFCDKEFIEHDLGYKSKKLIEICNSCFLKGLPKHSPTG